jgi:hypothetical protein
MRRMKSALDCYRPTGVRTQISRSPIPALNARIPGRPLALEKENQTRQMQFLRKRGTASGL